MTNKNSNKNNVPKQQQLQITDKNLFIVVTIHGK